MVDLQLYCLLDIGRDERCSVGACFKHASGRIILVCLANLSSGL